MPGVFFHYVKFYLLFSQFEVRCALDVKVSSCQLFFYVICDTPLKVPIVRLVFNVYVVFIF